MPPTPGMRFGRYELLSRLGAGGMGEVWRARDQDLHREVAVKFLPEKFAADPNRFSRFSQEALAASKLTHPNIVTIHDIGETSGLHYIVMELVDGETLREILLAQGERPLPARRLLEIGAQIADGLAKAHAAGIVHRDLKPENVMVTSDGFVKILDFGLVKLRGDSSAGHEQWFDSGAPTWPESPSPQTAAGAVLGTAGYMSPEQARGRAVDHRSDQFNLGAILYELATGRQAFRRETPAQTIAAIIDAVPEPLATLCPALPPPVGWLIERCLAKDPGERYASTLDLARELRSIREHLSDVTSGSASRPGERPWARRFTRARRLVLLAVALAAALWWGAPGLERRVTVGLGLLSLPAEKRVVVLPFEAPSGSVEDKARANGIVHLMTNRLARLEAFPANLSVEPVSNVLQAGVRSAAEARRALNATLVVTGSIQQVGGRTVLTANIEDTRRNRTVRAARAETEDALVEEVVRLLELELAAAGEATLRASTAGVAEAATLAAQGLAYTPYSEGRTALERYDQAKSLERAIELFNQALERDPRYALAHAGLAEAFWRRYRIEKDPEQARLSEEHARRALEIDDLPASGWTTIGTICAGTGRAEEALADFDKALQRDPRSPDAHRERGLALERLGRWGEAEATYRRAIELRPDWWSNYNYLGGFLYGRGRLPEAEAAFRAAQKLVPGNARVLGNLGGVVHAQGRLEEAEGLYRESLALNPTDAVAGNLAALQFDEKRYADAAQTLEQAVAAGTRNYRTWQGLASARYWAPGRRDESREAYRRAAALAEEQRRVDPGDPVLLAYLADCQAMLDEPGLARRLAGQAVTLAPLDQEVAGVVAGVHAHLGDMDAALHWLDVALRSGQPLRTIEADPTFEGLRADPRWAKLAGKYRKD